MNKNDGRDVTLAGGSNDGLTVKVYGRVLAIPAVDSPALKEIYVMTGHVRDGIEVWRFQSTIRNDD